jgi:hypothetical protein
MKQEPSKNVYAPISVSKFIPTKHGVTLTFKALIDLKNRVSVILAKTIN